MTRTILHIVGGDSRSRAEQARAAFALGHHAEVYTGFDELLERPPSEGIILAADDRRADTAKRLIVELAERGVWLPVVFVAETPDTERVVAAIKSGALDYLALPFEIGSFARRLDAILAEAGEHAYQRRRQVEAQHAIARLSRRERQVLELLSGGCSNKEIARILEISPRTVEIHRGNMMTKLDAGHAADAVRLWIDASDGEPALSDGDDRRNPLRDTGIAGRIGERRGVRPERAAKRRQRQ